MKREDYKRLGDYIREVDVRNKRLEVTNLMGININKYFMPSVANVVGTDMSNYKIVSKNQFACNLMHVGRDGKIPVALNSNNTDIIVSPAYFVFEIVSTEELIPDFLMMWFLRSEFDREASYFTDADIRGGLSKNSFFDMCIPVPTFEQQRKIVSDYEILTHRIKLNEKMIQRLEDIAQTIYRKMFVDDIDPENLPEGWRMGTIGEFCKEVKSGGTPSRSNNVYWEHQDYPWLKTGEVHNNIIIDTEEFISEKGLKHSSAKLIEKGSIIMAMYGATAAQVGYLDIETTTNQACCNMTCKSKEDASFLFFHLLQHQNDIKRLANGGAQENLSQELIVQQPILIIDDNRFKEPFYLYLII